ncbi:MAG: hydrogenase subunit MbhD domain-containing protein, partial [Cyanobacteria bacterium J06631_2]
MIDKYIYVIVALLPITSLILVFQSNPYQALVVRAILGAVAALVYATLGGSDVALTEALVGTMLATTLYVVTVRSSLVMRLGVLNRSEIEETDYFTEFLSSLKRGIAQYHLRL